MQDPTTTSWERVVSALDPEAFDPEFEFTTDATIDALLFQREQDRRFAA